MGCWDETDAITHVPILYDENVVMIELTQEACDDNFRWTDNSATMHEDYITQIYKGIYDGYGWIKEARSLNQFDDDRPDLRTIFIRQKNWDFIVDFANCYKWPIKSQLDSFKFWNKRDSKINHFEELIAITIFVSLARLNLNVGLSCKGAQHYGEEQTKLLELFQNMVSSNIRSLKESHD